MRAANHPIKRVKHPMPTIDELIHDLNGCRVFTKLNIVQGYHQLNSIQKADISQHLAHTKVYTDTNG